MKQFRIAATVLAVFAAVLTDSKPLYAQEWSPSQKEVWKIVEEITLLWSKGDNDGLYKLVHTDEVFWNYSNPVPISYESVKKFDVLFAKRYKVMEYTSKPLTIQVYDSFAVVNFVLIAYQMADDNKLTHITWRATWVFKKEGGKWLLVANHGGDYSQVK